MALAFVDHNASVLVVAANREVAAPVLDHLFDQGVAFVFSRPADLSLAGAALKACYRMAVVLDLEIDTRIRDSAQLLARQLPCVLVSDGPLTRRDDFRAVLHTDTSPNELFATMQSLLGERGAGKALTGDTPAIRQARWLIERVAPKATPVLLSGEVGVGKAVAAREIHRGSGRRGPLVTVQCAAIAEADVDTALFGSPEMQGGYLSAVAGGTLVLDEVTDMTPAFQARLLELLKTGHYTPAGQAQSQPLNARIIATTRQPLQTMVDSALRPDLYYELAVFPIRLPPLRERRDDIEALVDTLGAGLPGGTPRFDAQAMIELRRHGWPGNVQELSNLIERLAILFPRTSIDRATLEAHLDIDTAPPQHAASSLASVVGTDQPTDQIAAMALPEAGVDLRALSELLEKHFIEQALARHDRVVAHAARTLGLRRTTLTEKLRRYAIRTD